MNSIHFQPQYQTVLQHANPQTAKQQQVGGFLPEGDLIDDVLMGGFVPDGDWMHQPEIAPDMVAAEQQQVGGFLGEGERMEDAMMEDVALNGDGMYQPQMAADLPMGVQEMNTLQGTLAFPDFGGGNFNVQENAQPGHPADRSLWFNDMPNLPQAPPGFPVTPAIPHILPNTWQGVVVPHLNNTVVGWNANVPQRQPTVATDTIENLFALLLLQVRDKDAEIRELRQQIGDRDVENQQLRQQIGDKNAEIQELKVAAARTTAASSSESVSPFENDSDEEEDTLPVGGSLATSPLRMHWPAKRAFPKSVPKGKWGGSPEADPAPNHIMRLITAAKGGPVRCYPTACRFWALLHADVVKIDVSVRAYASRNDPTKGLFWHSLYRDIAIDGVEPDFKLGNEGYTAVALDMRRFNPSTNAREGLRSGWGKEFTGGRRRTYELCLVAWTEATEDRAAMSDHINVWMQPNYH